MIFWKEVPYVDTFPMLDTPRLHLREVTLDDAEAAFEIYGDELHPAYHKQGIMQEALSEMIRFGFTTMKLNRIEAQTDAFNHSSQKTINSLNFKLEGVQRQAQYEDDHFVDMLLYGLLKEDWALD